MNKILTILALLSCFCISCSEQSHQAPPVKKDYTIVGRVDRCTVLLKFVDGSNTCYVMDYCGSGNATLSCLKNEVAPSK